MKFIITIAKLHDIEEINNMLTNLIQDERKNYDDNINENYKVKNFYEQFTNNKDACILIAKYNNETLGYVYGFIQNNGNIFNKNIAQIDALFVKEQYRGNGISKKLIQEFTKWAKDKGCSYVELSVCNNNLKAINLYKNEGFKTEKLILKKKV